MTEPQKRLWEPPRLETVGENIEASANNGERISQPNHRQLDDPREDWRQYRVIYRDGRGNGGGYKNPGIALTSLVAVVVSVLSGTIAAFGYMRTQAEQVIAPLEQRIRNIDAHLEATDRAVALKRDMDDSLRSLEDVNRQLSDIRETQSQVVLRMQSLVTRDERLEILKDIDEADTRIERIIDRLTDRVNANERNIERMMGRVIRPQMETQR